MILLRMLKDALNRNFKALILYGSRAKENARDDSDIDLLLVVEHLDSKTRKLIEKIRHCINSDQFISLTSVTEKDFIKEKVPLYTAVKREGKIIGGDINLSENPQPPKLKYKEFFLKSKEFETRKVRMAEEILKEHPSLMSIDLCYIAAKHSIQAVLAMKGAGYSSKVNVLMPLARKYLGPEITTEFGKLFQLYVRTEYSMEFLTEKESRNAVKLARTIMKVYENVEANHEY